jgi:hypothetical protein
MCLQGASRVAAALAQIPMDALQTYVVWVPMLPPDTAEAAEAAAAGFPGASHYWDAGRVLAVQLGRTLGITSLESIGAPGDHGLAWDVYLAYGRGNTNLHEPDFWMHQLAVKHVPRLDPDEFRRQVEPLLPP